MISIDYKIVSSLEKVFCGKNFNGRALEEISALRGERVNFQIAICCADCAGGINALSECHGCGKIHLTNWWATCILRTGCFEN